MFKIFIVFFKIGIFTFGGGYAMISLIDKELVQNRKWLTEDELHNMLIVAESTPGPIAINVATYIGYKQAKLLGSILATLGVVLPSFIVITLITSFLYQYMSNQYVVYAFMGIKAGVIVLILNAFIKLIKKVNKNLFNLCLLLSALLISLFISIDTIYIILFGLILGIVLQFIKNKGGLKA